MQFEPVRSFHAHPLLLKAFAARLRAANPDDDEEIVFTAHSLPLLARHSGRRSLRDRGRGDRARGVAALRRHRAPPLPESDRTHAGNPGSGSISPA